MSRYLMLCLLLGAIGCSGTAPTPTNSARSTQRLPPEVELSPEEAIKQQTGRNPRR